MSRTDLTPALILLVLASPPPARACGPFLPQSLITAPPDSAWVAPVADFGQEVRRLAPPPRYAASSLSAIDLELAELRPLGIDPAAWRAWREGRVRTMPTLPEHVSQEFKIYAEGGAAWRRGDRALAASLFSQLLALPEAERPSRTVWATYMLAEHRMDEADFDAVLRLVDAGAPDPLGLATASLGEKARIHLWDHDWRGAADLYLQQDADGDPGGVPSLRLVIAQAIEADTLGAFAGDPVLSRVATAWLLSRGGPYPSEAELERSRGWLAAVEAADLHAMPDADHLAWLHYQMGDIADTQAWLARSEETPLTHWLRGRLLLREGRLAEAERELVAAARSFPAREFWSDGAILDRERWSGLSPAEEAWGDVGLTRLAREDWDGALSAFLASGSWQDSAYVAERLLPLSEACAIAGSLPAAPIPPALLYDDGWARSQPEQPIPPASSAATVTASALRYVVARRALREGQPVNLQDLPPVYRADARRLIEARARAESAISPKARAAALWAEARVTRARGLELLGTELDPDYAAAAGDFEVYPPTVDRFTPSQRSAWGPLAATAAEEARFRASAPEPDRRWHYRYEAARLAVEAADLLDEHDPDVAILLCRAGRWVHSADFELAVAYENEALRRTGRFFPPVCGEPAFAGEVGGLLPALAAALALSALVLWAGARDRVRTIP